MVRNFLEKAARLFFASTTSLIAANPLLTLAASVYFYDPKNRFTVFITMLPDPPMPDLKMPHWIRNSRRYKRPLKPLGSSIAFSSATNCITFRIPS